MTLNSDAKFEYILTCGFKNGMRNWVNFHRNCVMTLKGDAKFKGKMTCGLKNDIGNLFNFDASSQKSENLHFDELLLSKAYKALDKKVQKSNIS